jgi:hypothetical protein
VTLKPIAFRSIGLWLPGVRVEVEDVREAHRKTCHICAKTPEVRRLHVQTGSGRSASTAVLCASCGVMWVEMVLREGKRVVGVLNGTITDGRPVRLGWDVKHQRSIWLKTKMRPKPKEPKP